MNLPCKKCFELFRFLGLNLQPFSYHLRSLTTRLHNPRKALRNQTKKEVCMWHVGSQVSVFRTCVVIVWSGVE